MKRLVIYSTSALALACAASAAADSPRIKGHYGFTGSAVCLVAPGSSVSTFNPTPGVALPNSGFDANLQPIDGHVFSHSFVVEGIRIFKGDGTGTVTGVSMGTTVPPTPGPLATAGYPSFPPAAGASNFSYSFTYTVNPDGSWTADIVPGTFTETFTEGPRTGQTSTIVNFPTFTGLRGRDDFTLTVATLDATVESVSYSNGDVWPEICHRSRVLIKLGD
jgi:hypothetical protein